MSKINGLKWGVIVPVLAMLGGAIVGGCWAMTLRNANRNQANAVEIASNRATTEGVREDVRYIRDEQRRQSKKLDDILDRLSR